jgi:hypothetical protein
MGEAKGKFASGTRPTVSVVSVISVVSTSSGWSSGRIVPLENEGRHVVERDGLGV